MESKLTPAVLAACRLALKPLIRMLLKHGVMHREFVELGKELYVESARRDYGIRGRPTNDSRVALLTGLDRKEVARLKKKLTAAAATTEGADPRRRQQDRIARVLSAWHQDPAYRQADGRPLVLPLDGPAPSFRQLCKDYGGDVPAVTILRELKRTQALRQSRNRLTVLRRNYRLDTADPASVARAGSVLADIGQTVVHNLYRGAAEPSRLEARASNVRLAESALPAYREFIYAEGQLFLEKVDQWLTRHEAREGERGRDPRRIGIGLYWIQSEDSAGGGS